MVLAGVPAVAFVRCSRLFISGALTKPLQVIGSNVPPDNQSWITQIIRNSLVVAIFNSVFNKYVAPPVARQLAYLRYIDIYIHLHLVLLWSSRTLRGKCQCAEPCL